MPPNHPSTLRLKTAFAALGVPASEVGDHLESDLWKVPLLDDLQAGTPFENRLGAFLRTQYGRTAGIEELRKAADRICADWQQGFHPDPHLQDVLATLAARLPLGLVSNFDHPPHCLRLLDDLDVRRHFEIVLISGEVGVAKPDPRILEMACAELRAAPERCFYVGDSLSDYHAASAAGMSFCWVNRGIPGSTETDYGELRECSENGTCSEISELKGLLDTDDSRPILC